MLLPRPATDLDLAFPAHVLGTFLPKPEWVGNRSLWINSPWARLVEGILMNNPPDLTCTMEQDSVLVERHVRVCLGSFEPSYEDKIVGVAFILALWMKVDWPPEQQGMAEEFQTLAWEKATSLEWDPIS